MRAQHKAVQTPPFRVFEVRREQAVLGGLRAQLLAPHAKGGPGPAAKVEEFILNRIGSLGMQAQHKREPNCYLRSPILCPQLFGVERGRLACKFEQRARLLSHYLGRQRSFLELRRTVRNVFASRKRWGLQGCAGLELAVLGVLGVLAVLAVLGVEHLLFELGMRASLGWADRDGQEAAGSLWRVALAGRPSTAPPPRPPEQC